MTYDLDKFFSFISQKVEILESLKLQGGQDFNSTCFNNVAPSSPNRHRMEPRAKHPRRVKNSDKGVD